MSKVRVMLVDDSAIVRGMMQRGLAVDPNIDIVATAADGAQALESLKKTPADVIVLDIEMPVMDGLTVLPHLMKLQPKPKVIMASTLTLRNAEISMKALELGATDYLAKPSSAGAGVQEFYRDLIEKIKVLGASRSPVAAPTAAAAPAAAPAARAAVSAPAVKPASANTTSLSDAMAGVPRAQAIAIASSTGGPQALISLFTALKGKKFPIPMFITQHMPQSFTTILAEHIARASGSDCHEGKDGEEVKPGIVYLAPGDYHMVPERSGVNIKIRLNQNPPENFCRPSADPMLRGLSSIYGKGLLTIVLTGMGSDGSLGSAEVVRQGGTVAAQNEATCVVYGMPRAVVDAGLPKAILPLDQFAPYLCKSMGIA